MHDTVDLADDIWVSDRHAAHVLAVDNLHGDVADVDLVLLRSDSAVVVDNYGAETPELVVERGECQRPDHSLCWDWEAGPGGGPGHNKMWGQSLALHGTLGLGWGSVEHHTLAPANWSST